MSVLIVVERRLPSGWLITAVSAGALAELAGESGVAAVLLRLHLAAVARVGLGGEGCATFLFRS